MPTDTTSTVGLNIRAEMGRKRCSMAKLSRQTRVPRSTLTEQIDNNRVTVDTLMKIARALDVDASDLLPEGPIEASA